MFCTLLGMVMQLYSWLQEHPNSSQLEIDNILDGNICRSHICNLDLRNDTKITSTITFSNIQPLGYLSIMIIRREKKNNIQGCTKSGDKKLTTQKNLECCKQFYRLGFNFYTILLKFCVAKGSFHYLLCFF